MIKMIEDHHHRSNLTIKKHHEGWRARIMDHGVPGQNPKKGGVRGGPKNRQILHTGGEIWGGGFLGGSPKTGIIKHEVLCHDKT